MTDPVSAEVDAGLTERKELAGRLRDALYGLYEFVSSDQCAVPDSQYGRVTEAASALAEYDSLSPPEGVGLTRYALHDCRDGSSVLLPSTEPYAAWVRYEDAAAAIADLEQRLAEAEVIDEERAHFTKRSLAAERDLAEARKRIGDGPQVKPLVWVPRLGVDGVFDADSPLGRVIVSITDDGRGHWFISGLTGSNYVGSTAEEAMAAANAGYEAIIRSALDASSPRGIDDMTRLAIVCGNADWDGEKVCPTCDGKGYVDALRPTPTDKAEG